MHYGTWPQIEQDPKEFERLVRKESKAKVKIMAPGDVMEV